VFPKKASMPDLPLPRQSPPLFSLFIKVPLSLTGPSPSPSFLPLLAVPALTPVFGWVNSHAWAGIDITPTPKLAAWVERIKARPGVHNGLGVPERRKPPTKEEEEKIAEEAKKWIFKK